MEDSCWISVTYLSNWKVSLYVLLQLFAAVISLKMCQGGLFAPGMMQTRDDANQGWRKPGMMQTREFPDMYKQ